MKRVLAICLMIVMVVSISVTAFAAPNGFVNSPSGNKAPTVEETTPNNEDCTAEVVITPYSDKHELPEELRELVEEAYKDITEAEDLGDLVDELEKIAEEKNIDISKLSVSDLFNIHTEDCASHVGHTFDVKLSADTLENFVGLIHLDKNGEWKMIDDAKIVNGEHLLFTLDSEGPYAVVVDTTGNTPQTGDNSNVLPYIILMAASAVGFVVVLVISKKKKSF